MNRPLAELQDWLPDALVHVRVVDSDRIGTDDYICGASIELASLVIGEPAQEMVLPMTVLGALAATEGGPTVTVAVKLESAEAKESSIHAAGVSAQITMKDLQLRFPTMTSGWACKLMEHSKIEDGDEDDDGEGGGEQKKGGAQESAESKQHGPESKIAHLQGAHADGRLGALSQRVGELDQKVDRQSQKIDEMMALLRDLRLKLGV